MADGPSASRGDPAMAEPTFGNRLSRAFAHNDNRQTRPLLDALAHGFAAVEADIHLVEGELLLGHGTRDLRPGQTLSSVYLDPLAGIVEEHGAIYQDAPLVLLVDVKSDAAPTWRVLRETLAAYDGMLSQHRHDGVLSGPVSVVVSGHVDLPAMEADLVRFASADGRLGDLTTGLSPVVSMVSAKWSKVFRWHGLGRLPERQRARLREFVSEAHRRGLAIRFWGTREAMWPELDAAGVDLILADDLPGMAEYFAGGAGPESARRTDP
jgi:hypothetical protein